MIRTFIAIPVPQKITPFLHAMGGSLPGAKAVPPEQIHITIRFIGEIEWLLFQDIMESLHQVKQEKFQIAIKGVGHFPPRGKPRVLWAGLNEKNNISQLKNRIDRQLKSCGIPPDSRKFSPHVTFARLKSTSLQRVTEFLSGNAFLEFDEFTVSEFHLYSSKLNNKGAIHTIEEKYPLM